MELKRFLKEKNKKVKELNADDVIDLLCVYGFDIESDKYQKIKNKISTFDADAQTILKEAKNNLVTCFELTDNEDIKKFEKMRSMLRKTDISEREKINLNYENVIQLSYDEVCQLFEQEVKGKDSNQSVEWYRYFEDNSIEGKFLFEKAPAFFFECLNLNEGQQSNLTELLKKIKPPATTTYSLEFNHANTGFVAAGGSVHIGNNANISGNTVDKNKK